MMSYELIDDSEVIAFGDFEQAKAYATEKGLKEAEYGDVYGSKLSYCYWNESGNRYDTEQVIAYYTFGKDGKPHSIDDDSLRKYLFN